MQEWNPPVPGSVTGTSANAGTPPGIPPVAGSWGDKPDQFSDRVKASHPVICKDIDRHARYALAMEMIHSRHSKYALVDLVNWLLTKWPELQSEANR